MPAVTYKCGRTFTDPRLDNLALSSGVTFKVKHNGSLFCKSNCKLYMAICTEYAIVNDESTSFPFLKHTYKLKFCDAKPRYSRSIIVIGVCQ